jgi:DNA-binding response OmpR family regulator
MATILLVEDDEIMLKAIKNILSRDGHEVLTAKDGKEAFEKMENSTYDIVISDLMMPYANGLEIVSRLRADINRRHVGIIVVSSVGNEETITEAFRLGADDYLKKPIMAGELLIRIRKLQANRSNSSKLVTKKK